METKGIEVSIPFVWVLFCNFTNYNMKLIFHLKDMLGNFKKISVTGVSNLL